jgi:hypothetical protein
MSSHVRALAILQIVYSSLGLLLGVSIFLLFGGIATIVGFSASLDDSMVAVPVLALIGGIAASLIIVLSLPRLIAGIGLLKHHNWARILTMNRQRDRPHRLPRRHGAGWIWLMGAAAP